MDVAANNGVHPDACLLAQNDISNHLSGLVHVAGSRNGRTNSLVGTDHVISVPLSHRHQGRWDSGTLLRVLCKYLKLNRLRRNLRMGKPSEKYLVSQSKKTMIFGIIVV